MAYEQQRASCRPRGAIRLAHLPGDAAVSPGAARLLSAWRTRSLTPDQRRPVSSMKGRLVSRGSLTVVDVRGVRGRARGSQGVRDA